jgi:hypothetical protein
VDVVIGIRSNGETVAWQREPAAYEPGYKLRISSRQFPVPRCIHTHTHSRDARSLHEMDTINRITGKRACLSDFSSPKLLNCF